MAVMIVGCGQSDESDRAAAGQGTSVAQGLLSDVSVLGWYPGSTVPPATRLQAGLFYPEDIAENMPASALQDAFTARNERLKPAFREAFAKYGYGARSDAHPACPTVAAPNVIINGYAKPYEFAQTEFLSWLSTQTGQSDFLSPAARRVNPYKGDQECPLTSTDTTLSRTFGQRVQFDGGALTLTTDNSVNPWRWVAPINPVHHHEQPSLFVSLPPRDQATKDEIRALLAANLRGDMSARLLLDYDVDVTAIDLRAALGEATAESIIGAAPGQDLLSATYHDTRRLGDPRFNEYLDKRFVAPSLQMSVTVNWRENDAGYRLSEFQLVGFNYQPALIWGPPSPNQTINAYTTEGGGSGISAWTRVKSSAMKLASLTPSIFVAGGDYAELPDANFNGRLTGTIDLSAYYLVSHGHQFFPGLPDPNTNRDELAWIGFMYEAHGPMKVSATVRRLNARVVGAANGACGIAENTCASGTVADEPDTASALAWRCVGATGGTTAVCSLARAVNGACGAAENACAAGTFVDMADTASASVWSCVGSGGGSMAPCTVPKGPVVVAVDGRCSAAENTCAAGMLVDTPDTASAWSWSCVGTSGGTTASCSLAKPPVVVPVDGACSSSENACVSGSFVDVPDTTRFVRWQCSGASGGVTASCSVEKPVDGACGTSVGACATGDFVDVPDTSTQGLWTCVGTGGGATAQCAVSLVTWSWVSRTTSSVDHGVSYPGYTVPVGYVVEGPVFKVASAGTSGMVPLYDCQSGLDTFVSGSSACAGQTRMSSNPIGYVFAGGGSGRTAIYRCGVGNDHFVSTSATCEIGVSPEGILGYF